MKVALASTLLAGLVGLCGCAHQYPMKLSDGDQLLSLSKPRPQGTNYYFTDSTGAACVIEQSQVVKIRAVSVVKEEQKPAPPAKPPKPRHWYFLWLA